MPKINCTLANCSHNKSGVCFSNAININGVFASTSANTNCASFIDKTQSTSSSAVNNSACKSITCEAQNCRYNTDNACNLSYINVSGTPCSGYCTNTYCSSFIPR